MRTTIGEKAIIEDSVIMGSDIYQVRVVLFFFFLITFHFFLLQKKYKHIF
jgi:hypothetical protein